MNTSSFVAPSEWSEPEKRLVENYKSPIGDTETTLNKVQNVALATATARQRPSLLTKSMFKLYICLFIPILISCANGYNGSVMGGVNAYPQYRRYFGFDADGGTPPTGIVYAIYPIGNIIGAFAVGPASDARGRKWGMCAGCLIILVFTIFQATSTTLAQFMVSRFMMGVGIAICQGAGLVYSAELAHPSFRGPMTALYNSFWYIGSAPGGFISYGASTITGPQSWRIPLWGQAFFPVLVLCSAPFLPESPRWLIANSKHEEAIRIMAKFHGEGDRFSPIVQLEYKEMVEEISTTGADKRWWDYRCLFDSGETQYRSMIVIAMGFIGQWTGVGPIAYYEGAMLRGAQWEKGGTSSLYGGVAQAVQFVAAAFGAMITDKIGRRRQFIIPTTLMIMILVVVTSLTAINLVEVGGQLTSRSSSQAKAIVCLYWLFGVVFSLGYTPLQILYPLESLRYESRAKGMGLYAISVSAAGFYSTMATNLAFTSASWRYYFLFILWNVAALIFMFFLFPETRNRTLEELTEVFTARRPVKKSLETCQVVIKGQEIIVNKEKSIE